MQRNRAEWSRRQARRQHELPGPGNHQPVLLHDAERHHAARSVESPISSGRPQRPGRPVQVLRRLVDADPGPAGAVRREVQVPERRGQGQRHGAHRCMPSTDNWSVQLDPTTYKTNCTICTANPDDGTPMLPAGKYVVEVVVPEGFELVKEEDKNILIGDAYHRAGDAAVRRPRRHLHHARPGRGERPLQRLQPAPVDREQRRRHPAAKATPARSRSSGPASVTCASFPT